MSTEVLSDAGAGPAIRAERIAERSEPTISQLQDVRRNLPNLPSDAVLPAPVREAVEALDAAELRAVEAIDDLGISRRAIRRAAMADAQALHDAAEAGEDLTAIPHDAHQRVALAEHERAVAVARALVSVVHRRANEVRAAAREHAAGVEQAACRRLDEIAAKHVQATEAFATSFDQYGGALADAATAIAYRAELDYRARPGHQFDHERRAYVGRVPKPDLSAEVSIGNQRVNVRDALAALVAHSRRHVLTEHQRTTDDELLAEAFAAATHPRHGRAIVQ